VKFGILRIVGNELFPRDKKGSRFSVIKTIISVEPEFNECEKIWILNRIWNSQLKSNLYCYLTKQNHLVFDIPFERKIFNCLSDREKFRYLLTLNSARNKALKIGREKYQYSILLDGDCFFNFLQWHSFIEKFNSFENPNNSIHILSFPVKRLSYKNGRMRMINNHKEEPQLAFSSSSTFLFDDKILYGFRDKVNLLKKMGFVRSSKFSNYYYPNNGLFFEMGEVSHLANSNIHLEKFSSLRKIARMFALFFLSLRIFFKLV
jgi:hypothetical protein